MLAAAFKKCISLGLFAPPTTTTTTMNLYDDTDEVDTPSFGINAGYADAFEKKKRTEELSKRTLRWSLFFCSL